uniref:Secreted protein n=1 Tax=Anguilla anguilla TaxID=7936 RepID=A0A0E9QNA5_ANGAN
MFSVFFCFCFCFFCFLMAVPFIQPHAFPEELISAFCSVDMSGDVTAYKLNLIGWKHKMVEQLCSIVSHCSFNEMAKA